MTEPKYRELTDDEPAVCGGCGAHGLSNHRCIDRFERYASARAAGLSDAASTALAATTGPMFYVPTHAPGTESTACAHE
jgi:hypothetical protein